MKEKHWQHFYHQADIGVRGIGPNLSEAFEQAALAMMAVICNPENVALTEQIDIERTCDDRPGWVNGTCCRYTPVQLQANSAAVGRIVQVTAQSSHDDGIDAIVFDHAPLQTV